jgi:hypothetical protein
MRYRADTGVILEPMPKCPEPKVLARVDSTDSGSAAYQSVITQ